MNHYFECNFEGSRFLRIIKRLTASERGEGCTQKYLHEHFLINNPKITLSIKVTYRILQKNTGRLSLRP